MSATISIRQIAAALVILLPSGAPTDFLPREVSQAREHVHRIYPSAGTVREIRIPLDDAVLDDACTEGWLEPEMSLLVPSRGDTVLGYVVLDNVRGKDQLITYMVAVTVDLTVRDLEILTYREPYGYEVRYESWQEQFTGKGPGEDLRPGREIRNISGATISVRSVTYGVRKILCSLRKFKEQLPR